MNAITSLSKFIGGDLFKEIKEGVMSYFPPDLSPIQKLEAEMKLNEMLSKKELEANRVLNDAANQLDKRISEQEGTAKDLKTIPILGTIVIFMRGMQRPIWGFGTMWMDYKWFFCNGTFTEQQQTAMIFINILVLGFLFGERTVKNLEPLLTKIFAK